MKVSLLYYDTYDSQLRSVNTPKSVEACKRLGILPEELIYVSDKDFKENFYTNRNHGISGGNTRNHLLRQITTWFTEHLK